MASNGGTLVLTGSAGGGFTNTGTIAALTGSEVQMTGGIALSGGTLSSTGTGDIRNVGGQTVTLSDLTNTGNFITDNNARTNLSGTITNSGTIQVNAINSTTDLTLVDDTTLTGGGTVILSTPGGSAQIDGGHVLTIDNQTIQGFGNLGANSASVINNGLVNANVNGQTLTLDPANTSIGFVNNATLMASNGGVLILSGNAGGGFTNTGTIAALNGSEVQLSNGFTSNGGTLTTTGSGVIRNLGGQVIFLSDLTLSGNLVTDNNSDTHVSGTINNTGTFLLNSTNSATRLIVDGSTSFTGAGHVILTGPNAQIAGGGSITFGAGQIVQGQGNVGANSVSIINDGLIDANTAATPLVIDPPSTGLTNNGTIQASNGGVALFTGSAGGGITNNAFLQATGAGSEFQLTGGGTITGGTLNAINGGLFRINGGQIASLTDLTNTGTFIVDNNAQANVSGTITNNGTITVNSVNSTTDIVVVGGSVTFSGSGTVVLSGPSAQIGGSGNLTNGGSHTIQGQGNVGANGLSIINNGLINANVAGQTLTLDPNGGGSLDSSGTLRASNGGLLNLSGNAGGDFTNDSGTIEALDGSKVSTDSNGTLTNDVSGVLTGGSYRGVSTGSGATLLFNGAAITQIAGSTTVELTGPASTISFGGTALESSLTTNNGALKILGSRTYTTANAFTNGVTATDVALLQLGGGTFDAPSLVNNGSATLSGFGTVVPRPTNHGTIRAVGGTLVFLDGINGGSGTIEAVNGATIDLSGGASDSSADFLLLDGGGHLNLGSHNVSVAVDYNNANAGIGNSFNPRANVTGTGGINASPAVQQTLGADVTNGAAATPSLNLGNIRVGGSVSKGFVINDVGPGPSLRGAIQTSVNGGSVTDPRLSGAGVTAQNIGPITAGSSTGLYSVLFTGSGPGALTGQTVAIVNNFDNVADQALSITGAAYTPATASVSSPINLGNFHVGDTVTGQGITISNTAPASAFSEDLLANNFAASPDALIGGSSPASELVTAGSNNSQLIAQISTAAAGARTGTITMNLSTNATVNGSPIPGLSAQSIGSATVTVNANVYRLGTPSVPTTVDIGQFHVGSLATGSIVVSNTAVNDGFSESVRAFVNGVTPDVTTASGDVTVAPGSNSANGITATLSTATAGQRSGTVALALNSVAGGAGLSNTNLTGATTTVKASVYRLASAQINNSQPINFGIVHVGDTITPVALSITNAAPNDGFSENLQASFGTHGPGITTTGSQTGLLAPQSNDASSLKVGIDTSSHQVINSSANVSLSSDGTGVNSLGRTDLPSQAVSITGQVNDFADPLLSKLLGNGTFTMSDATHYTLNLGDVTVGDSVSTTLRLTNDVTAPADNLAGSFVTGGAEYTYSGFGPINPAIAPGGTLDSLMIGLDTSSEGAFNGSVTFSPLSQNAQPFNGALPDVTLSITATVHTVPEPVMMPLLLGAGFMIRRRRRRE